MIKFESVTKKYPLGNIALNNVSFEIDDKEFVFLVGPSGAGKTTIIKLILHELTPSSGSIMINDLDITDRKFSKTIKLRRSIGTIFQDFKVLYDKNVFENIALGIKVMQKHDYNLKTKVREILKLINLADKEKVFPVQLSMGELQRVAIGRALVGDRKIILADEPTGNLDPKTSWEIMKIFKKIDGKKTVIIASHNTDIVNSLQKRVIVLKQGKIIKDHRTGGYEL